MKAFYCICIFFLFVFLFGCKTKMDVEVEKSNPLEGTTWEGVSYEAIGDTILSYPQSEFQHTIVIYGKTHYALVDQDTSMNGSFSLVGKYKFKGDSCTYTFLMHPNYEDIGYSFTFKVQFEDDKMIITGGDVHFEGHDWKTVREEWKMIN